MSAPSERDREMAVDALPRGFDAVASALAAARAEGEAAGERRLIAERDALAREVRAARLLLAGGRTLPPTRPPNANEREYDSARAANEAAGYPERRGHRRADGGEVSAPSEREYAQGALLAQRACRDYPDGRDAIVTAIATARAEGYRAGIEAAAKVVDRADAEWHDMEQATGREMLAACASAIRALAEKGGQG